MLDVAVKYVHEKKWGRLETLSWHLETDLGHLEAVFGLLLGQRRRRMSSNKTIMVFIYLSNMN